MARKVQTRTIDDVDVTVTQHPALDGLDLAAMIGRLIAPVIDRTPQLLATGLDVGKLNAQTLTAALGEAFKQLEGKRASEVARELLRCSIVVVQGEGNFDLSTPKGFKAFDGRGLTLVKAAMFAAEVNLAGFFPDSSKAPAPTAEAKALSPST